MLNYGNIYIHIFIDINLGSDELKLLTFSVRAC